MATRFSWVRRFAFNFATAAAAVVALSFVVTRDVSEAQTGFTCTEVVGYSQTHQWFRVANDVAGDSRWQLRYVGGGAARYWADPNFSAWRSAPISACATNSENPDRVIMDVTRDEYTSDVSVFERDIRNVIVAIRANNPGVRQIVLQPVVGGPGESRCPWSEAPFNAVRASYNHPYIIQAISRVVGGDVVRGADKHVRTCADYADDIGHLTTAAIDPIGRSIGSFYAASAPAPTATPKRTATPQRTATSTPVVTSTRTPTPGVGATTTPVRTATATKPPAGTSSGRYSVKFNGSTSYADAPNSQELSPQTDWTIESWFKDEDPAGYDHSRARMLTKGDAHVSGSVPYALSIASNQLAVVMRTNGQYVTLMWDLGANRVAPNTWHHAAATFRSSTRELALYFDGTLVARGTSPVGIANNTDPVTIGSDGPIGADSFWTGKLDDIRIWNVARTAAQIQSNYRGELQGAQAGLVGNWKFTEGTGQTAADSAGSPQNAALHSVTWAADVHS